MKPAEIRLRILISDDSHPLLLRELLKVRPKRRRERVLALMYSGLAAEAAPSLAPPTQQQAVSAEPANDHDDDAVGSGDLASAFGF